VIFGASVTRFRYTITLEGWVINTGHRMGFTTHESNHAECGGVYISANPITLSAEEFILYLQLRISGRKIEIVP